MFLRILHHAGRVDTTCRPLFSPKSGLSSLHFVGIAIVPRDTTIEFRAQFVEKCPDSRFAEISAVFF